MNIQHMPKEPVVLDEKGLFVTLGDGGQSYFNYYWLRDNCPSSFNTTTRERTFDIFHLSDAPKATQAKVRTDHLEIQWSNETHITRMPLETLRAYADGKRRADPSDMPRVAWFCDHYPQVARFTFQELHDDPAKLRDWLKATITHGVSIVSEMPNSDEGLTELATLMGKIRPTFFGDYFDVYTHINPTNTAYTAVALELHTDTPAEEFAPGIQFLHMRANSVDGGLSLFGDGVAVANDFRDIDPEGFELLSQTDIPFYCEHDGYDMRSYQRVIELDRHAEVSGLTISQHMLDMLDMPQSFLDDYYPALCRFGKLLQDEKYLMKFMLNAGECIVFDNHRIVHGREAYVASSGERYLRGTYVDRAEMRSTYRALTTQWRFAS